MSSCPILIGTHYHPGSAETLARQERARASLRQLPDVQLVNLQFPDAVIEVDGFRTVPKLFSDSVKASGRAGARKPLGREAFDCLAECAAEAGCEYFGWVNSDIIMTPAALEFVRDGGHDAVIFSRMDFDAATGSDAGMFIGGLDAFFFSPGWWREHRHRYRPYVNSEAYWDPVYATIALCHGRAVLWNRTGLVRHEMHPKVWRESPFGDYNRYFASLDTLYFNQWLAYRERLTELRAAGASETEEMEMQRRSFHWPPSMSARLIQSARAVKAHLRYRWQQTRWRRQSKDGG